MDANQLKNRTKKFSITILDLVEKLPNTISGRAVSNQIVRSGTSVGANYRAVCRARSDREFIAKMSRCKSPLNSFLISCIMFLEAVANPVFTFTP
jgi:four helix bundle protein